MIKKYTPVVIITWLVLVSFFVQTEETFAEGAQYTASREANGLIYKHGNPEAPVIFIQFQSQMCPYTKVFNLDTFPKLKEKYIDTGKVLFVSVPYVHNDDDMKAMKLVQCANDKNYWPLMNEMYRERDSWARQMWKGKMKRLAVEERMREIASKFGVDEASQEKCLNSKQMHKLLVTSRQSANKTYGVFRTPQYVINNKLYNEMSWSDIDYVIQQYLTKQKQ